MLKVFYGTNTFTKNLELAKLKEQFEQENGSMSVRSFEAENIVPADFLQELQATGLFASNELFIVKRAEDNLGLIVQVLEATQKNPLTKDLTLVIEVLDKRTTLYKDIQKLEGFIEFNEPSGSELNSWLQQVTRKLNLNLSTNLQAEIILRCEQNQQTIWFCLGQLSLLSKSEITIQDLDSFQAKLNSENAFNLLSFSLRRNYSGAAKTISELNLFRSDPYQIIGLLCSQVNSLVSVYFGQKSGKDSRTIASELALHPFAVSENARLLNSLKLSKNQLENLFDEVRWLDQSLKTVNKTEPWEMLDATLLKVSML